jgi:hypothetical protein
VVGDGEVQPEQADDGADEAFGLPEWQAEDGAQGQRRQAELEQCRVNVPGTTARKSLIVLGGLFGRRWNVVKTSEPKARNRLALRA